MIAVLGAGSHGRQIAAMRLAPDHATVLFDDRLREYEDCNVGSRRYQWVVGAAWPKVRREIAENQTTFPWNRGHVLFPGAQIGDNVRLGKHVHVGFNAVVTHGCELGDYVNVSPGAVISGDCFVDDDVFIGANATIIHGGIKIGAGALIGAGAVVLDNVAPGAVVAGVPARQLR